MWFLFGSVFGHWFRCRFFVWFVCLGGRISVKDFLPFKTRPVFAMISVFLFLFLVVWNMCRRRRSFSLSRSLSGAGVTQTF